MKRFLLTNLLNSSKSEIVSNPSSTLLVVASSTRYRLRFYSSESDSDSASKPDFNQFKNMPNVPVEDVVSEQELKKRIDKLYEGDENEIPGIFEAILKRKLAGVSDDDRLIESLGPRVQDDDYDDVLHTGSDSDGGLHTGSDSDCELYTGSESDDKLRTGSGSEFPSDFDEELHTNSNSDHGKRK
ncbi:uncharacterized protein LOC126688058 [Mercurialis annua]|uniref:uncharacterized protein LOC126688058 n=1 Tax=Mercurialis annua TaxID=3986 RepID=UPI00215EC09C|nr:uncharacterized protein LOC126688058 [Mercurialis annua]